MLKKSIFVIVIIQTCLFSTFSMNSQEAVKTAVASFELQIPLNAVAGVGNIVLEDKNIGSSFSAYIQEAIANELKQSSKFEFSDRRQLDLIMNEIKLGLTGVTDESTSVEPGLLRGLEYIVSGTYFVGEGSISLFLKLIEIESGLVVGDSRLDIEKNSIPRGISLFPPNYDDALYIIEELSDISGSGEGLDIRVWNTRGEGGTYRDGENLQVNFYSSTDCYIKLYHIDVNNKLSLIFPNQYYSDNFIKAGKIYRIPDSRYPFSFTLGSPYGIEFIKIAASTLQFDDIEEAFSELGTASSALLSRGLSVQKKEKQSAEEIFSYTILE